MGTRIKGGAARQLQAVFDLGALGVLDEADLLARYLRRDSHSEQAFECLVNRHAGMVFRVCLDVLGNAHDAQDAAQATFFILARKAGSIRNRDALSSWLHGTARRVAARSLRASLRRRHHERRSAEVSQTNSSEPVSTNLWASLHGEIASLPERYRVPIVLCDFTGLTHDQAAGKLGCPLRTLETRLYRGREKLKKKLIRRGIAPASALVGLNWATQSQAAMPSGLATSMASAACRIAKVGSWAAAGDVSAVAVGLAKGTLREMLMAKLRVVAFAGLLVGVLAGGAWSRMAMVKQPPAKQEAPARRPAVAEDRPDPRDAFDRAYSLAEGEDIKALFGRMIESRNEHYNGKWKEVGIGGDPAAGTRMSLVYGWRNAARNWRLTVTCGEEGVPIRSLIEPLLGVRESEVEGDLSMLDRAIPADFIVRSGMPAEKIISQFETILRRDFKLPIRLLLSTQNRDVIVVRGNYKHVPRVNLAPFPQGLASGSDRIEIYAREPGNPTDFQRNLLLGGHNFSSLLSNLGRYVGRPVISQLAKNPNGFFDVQITDFHVQKADSPEDRSLVFKHLSEQTGLTFHEEPKEVRVLRIERAD